MNDLVIALITLIIVIIILYLSKTIKKSYEKDDKPCVEIINIRGKKKLNPEEFKYLISELSAQVHQCVYFINDENMIPIQNILESSKKNIDLWIKAQKNKKLKITTDILDIKKENDMEAEIDSLSIGIISIDKLMTDSKQSRDDVGADNINVKQTIANISKCLHNIHDVINEEKITIKNNKPLDIIPIEKFLILFKKHSDVDKVISKKNVIPKMSNLEHIIFEEGENSSWKGESLIGMRKKGTNKFSGNKRISFSTVVQ